MNPRIVAYSLAAAALSGPCPVPAQDTFQTEAGLSYARATTDTSRQKAVGVDATYFFDKLPARPNDYPLEQVQFVERVGSVSANYARGPLDFDGDETLSNGWAYGVAAQFARPDSPLLASARYESLSTGKHGTPGGTDFEADAKAYQLALGAYVAKTTTLSLNWARSKTRNINSSLPDVNNTSTQVGLTGEHLGRVAAGGYVAIAAGAFQTTHESDDGSPSEKNKALSVLATYYPTKMLGLRLGVTVDRGDDQFSEGESYLLGARTFATPALSLSLDYQKFKAKMAGNDSDALLLRAALRF